MAEANAPAGPDPTYRDTYEVIDLSITLADGDDPSPLIPVGVKNLSHADGAKFHEKYLGVDPQDWPFPGESFGDDLIEATTHAGTHMDAPIHYGPKTIPDGEKPLTIDQIPIEWCMGDGVVIDISDIPQAHEVSAAEVQERLAAMDYELKPLDIVLVMTGNDKYWDDPETYLNRGGHLGREALKYILEQGVRVVGTDSWSFDRAGSQWAADYKANGNDPSYLWPCHVLGLEMPYCHMEKMCNLDKLPPHGFTVIALPIKVSGGSGAFIRAVGLVST